MLAALILITVLVLPATAEELGYNKVLHFPHPDGNNDTNYISFDPNIGETSAFSVCAWLRKTTNDRTRYWFSYAVPEQNNEVIIGEQDPGAVVLFIHDTKLSTESGVWPVDIWTHICVSWSDETGAFIAVNGEVMASQDDFRAGSVIRAGGTLVLGQEQDNISEEFDATQSYHGDIYNLNMWQQALSEAEVASLFNSGLCRYDKSDNETQPQVPYSVIYEQEPQGDAQFITGFCRDLEGTSIGKVLRFPPLSNVSTENYVQLTAVFGVEALSDLSICTWYFKTFTGENRYFLSYAIPGEANAIVFGESNSGYLGFWIQSSSLTSYMTTVMLEEQTWYHICATWNNDYGRGVIYVDGENVGEHSSPRSDLVPIPSGGILVLGQEQDSLGGSFDASQAFAGSLYNLYIFNVELSAGEVTEIYANGTFCAMLPDKFWTENKIAVSYSTIASMTPFGNAAFESSDEAWKHGAPSCSAPADHAAEEDGRNPDCWDTHQNRSSKDKDAIIGTMVVQDLETAQATCFATKICKALTCKEKSGEGISCVMRSVFNKVVKSSKHTSYTYTC